MTKKKPMQPRSFIGCFLIIGALLALSACNNTFEGVGRDLESAGEKIQKTF